VSQVGPIAMVKEQPQMEAPTRVVILKVKQMVKANLQILTAQDILVIT
jgi:hypothetical protein